MSIFGDLPNSDASVEEMIDAFSRLQKQLEYMMQRNLGTKNVRELGDWLVGPDSFKSRDGMVGISSAGTAGTSIRFWAGATNMAAAPYRVDQSGKLFSSNAEIAGKVTASSGAIGGWLIGSDFIADASGMVGMSSAVTGGDDIRIWAGSVTPSSAPFRVTEAGALTASSGVVGGWTLSSTKLSGSGILEGGTIQTNASGNQRIELSSGSLKGYTADNLLSGLVFDPNKLSDIIDLFLYHRGTKLVEFYDNLTSYTIRGTSGSTGFILGGNVTTYAEGAWQFQSGQTATFLGTAAFGSATVTGLTTDTYVVANHDHGIPNGTVLMVNGGGTVTFSSGGGFSHSHTVS